MKILFAMEKNLLYNTEDYGTCTIQKNYGTFIYYGKNFENIPKTMEL